MKGEFMSEKRAREPIVYWTNYMSMCSQENARAQWPKAEYADLRPYVELSALTDCEARLEESERLLALSRKQYDAKVLELDEEHSEYFDLEIKARDLRSKLEAANAMIAMRASVIKERDKAMAALKGAYEALSRAKFDFDMAIVSETGFNILAPKHIEERLANLERDFPELKNDK